MACAGRKAAGRPVQSRRPPIVDHHTYVFVGDGCLMEGLSHEACRWGTWGLGKLIAFYDDNGISIDGRCRAGSPTIRQAFRAYGWHVLAGVDGHDAAAVEAALKAAQEWATAQPICCKTVMAGCAESSRHRQAHGEALAPRSRGNARGSRLELPRVRDPAIGLHGLGPPPGGGEGAARMGCAIRRLRVGPSGARAGIQAPHGRRSARGFCVYRDCGCRSGERQR